MKNLYILLPIISLIALSSCKQEVKKETKAPDNIIEISIDQFKAENMELGKVGMEELEEKVSFTGQLVPTLNGVAKISASLAGKVINIRVQQGEYVKANEELLKIGGVELIDLQQNFASSSANIKQLKANFERAKALYNENINTETDYLLAESNYKSELANYSALKEKLQSIGLNPADIELGKYANYYSVKAPISGQISNINISIGQHINIETEMAEIVDKSKSELKLTLYEKDYLKIKTGQKVHFWSIDHNTKVSAAIIKRIGSLLNPSSGTIDCFASVIETTNKYALNQMVNGEIIIASDSVAAVPKTAMFNIGTNHYVLVFKSKEKNNYLFEKRKVSTGKSSDNFVEVKGEIDKEILLKGTYNLSLE